ncbi:XtrA/YqaO family protein [Carnobacterium maltaromaticum]|uniref:XtrA/YqaO family protein n=1 Tax=Carnobacterium maltaromaticum TaxID=2751 RepID=UPI0039BEB2C0
MKLSEIELDQIEKLRGSNSLVIFSNGQIKQMDLPSHGIVEITTHADKVTYVENKIKDKF